MAGACQPSARYGEHERCNGNDAEGFYKKVPVCGTIKTIHLIYHKEHAGGLLNNKFDSTRGTGEVRVQGSVRAQG